VFRTGGYNGTYTGVKNIHGLPFRDGSTSYDLSADFHQGKVGVVESIEDEPSGHGQYNEVTHSKVEWMNPLVPVSSRHESVYKSRDLVVDTSGLSASRNSLLSWAATNAYFGDSEANAVQRAVNSMQFDIQDAPFNLPVFLGELRDFKDVATRFSSGLIGLKNRRRDKKLYEDLFKSKSDLHRTPILEVAKAIASADLTYQFAIKPFINDLRAMLMTGKHLSSQLDRLRRTKPVVVRGSVNDSGALSPAYYKQTYPYRHYERAECIADRSITAWALCQYDWSVFPEPNEVLLLLDSLGFDQPLDTAWQLLPWSFLIDYFVGLSEFFNQFDGSYYDLPYTIIEDGYSVKTVYDATVTTYFDTGIYASEWDNTDVGSYAAGKVVTTTYKRRKGPLSYGSIALPTLGMPNLRQLGNIADLVILST
jgi:hypothetical protein